MGDLVEFPIPYLDYYDLGAFIKTLELIKHFPAAIKLSAHSGIVSEDLIDRNLSYIKGIQLGQPIPPEMIGLSTDVHQYNVNNRLLLKYEPLIREKYGKSFNYTSYKSNFLDLGEVNSDNFNATLEKYLSRLKILF